MKITGRYDILAKGPFPRSAEWRRACADVEKAIRKTDWPHGSGKFTIYPESGKKRNQGNGVCPIKKPCLGKLRELGWKTEKLPKIEGGVLRTGDLDALYQFDRCYIGFEWETGNISSSHRAINKLLLTLQLGGIKGGILVVPSDKLGEFLTDRIGNVSELQPYFPLWGTTHVKDGVLRIYEVEYDATSFDVPKIPKGKDGRALG
ncbi:MAG: hypothetical protein ABFD52_09290 [Acidobacteriota bacterium]